MGKRNNPPGARPTPAQPPRPVFHLPPAPVMSATCSTPCRSRGHGRPWSPPLPHLLPPAMDPIRPTPRTPWTPPHLHSPPPRLPRFGESFPERRRRHGSELTRPVTSSRHPTVSSVPLVVVLVPGRKESRREPPPRAHGRLPQLRPPRRRGGNPAPPRRHRGRSLHRYVPGELLH